MAEPAPDAGPLSAEDLRETWPFLSHEERIEGFRLLPRDEAEELLLSLGSSDQLDIVRALPAGQRRGWMRVLAPDDAADIIQQAREEERDALRTLLDEQVRIEVSALLAYAEDEAGGLMNTRYARVRPTIT